MSIVSRYTLWCEFGKASKSVLEVDKNHRGAFQLKKLLYAFCKNYFLSRKFYQKSEKSFCSKKISYDFPMSEMPLVDCYGTVEKLNL